MYLNPYEFVDEAWEMGQIDGTKIKAHTIREIQLNVSEMIGAGR